jgi:two-component system, sensor histidine kinase and response regulator
MEEKTMGLSNPMSTNWKYGIGLSLAYILSGFFCILYLSVPPDNYSLMWLPSGIGLILFMLMGYSATVWILIGSFVINTYYSFANRHFVPTLETTFWGMSFACIDVMEALIAWKIVLYLEKKNKFLFFTRNSQLISFFVFVCLLPSAITAVGLVALEMMKAGKLFPLPIFIKLVTYFTVGNSIGLLLVSPLYWATKNKDYYANEHKKGAISIIAVIAILILISFAKIPSLLFVIIPVLAILAKYGNLFYSIVGAFVICILLSLGTAYNYGFFAVHMDSDTSFETVLFLLSLVFVLLFSTIAFGELNLHKNKLQVLVDETVNTLEISEQQYRVLAENVMDVIWVLSLKLGRFTYISPSILQLRGYTAEEALKHRLEDSLTPDSVKRVNERLAIATKEFLANPNELVYYYDEFQQYHKDGSIIWIETVTHLIKNKQEELEVVGISRNISKRKEAEAIQQATNKRLDELNATKDKFFSIIAHDLMSPFNTLIGFSSLLNRQSAKNDMEGVAKSAKFMHDAAEKTKELLKNLLEWSQTQTGRIQFNPETIDVPNCVNEVLDLFKETSEQKGIEMKLDIPQEGSIIADKYMLSTILRNLVANAIKYTYPGGFLQVTALQKENEWLFHVTDNGVGMESELTTQIFQIGTHKSEAGTQKEQGTGLGLILCKEFVEKHGGKIWVDSKPGVGTVFGFNIPTK